MLQTVHEKTDDKVASNVCTYEEALKQSLEYFNENELSASVFLNKYALKDDKGNIVEPTPFHMHKRLASEFARIDAEKYGEDYNTRFNVYFKAMDKFARIVPQGSPMAAIGNKYQHLSSSNCIVVASPEDSIGGIFFTGTELAQLYKRRCGVGVDISTLRPDGMRVNNAARFTTGAWSFADYYSNVTRMIGMEARRGALMITIDVHHPDVIKFATMKQDLTKVTGANISVRLSNEFLKAVEEDTEYEQRWPCEGIPKINQKVSARTVWKTIIESATNTGEPGLILWDNMINNLPSHCYSQFKTISTNPCSEIALAAYGSCRLISINLTGYVVDAFTPNAHFDMSAFYNDVSTAMQMADNLVDLELELIERIKKICEPGIETELWDKLYKSGQNGRRTGLGTHGLGDTLAQLNIRYDSKNAISMVNDIYKTLRDSAYETSINLAKKRGPFPVFDWEKEKNCEFIQRLPQNLRDEMSIYGRRNIALLTQAPTGSVSILSKVGQFDRFNVSSGVEPVFRNSYIRRKKINNNDYDTRVDFVDIVGDKWQEYKVFHSNVKNYLEMHSLDDDVSLPDFFVTSDQIDWQKRIEIQATEQLYIDHSISSTINLPKGTSSDVVGALYLDAWKKGLKGVTVYVDGCRDGVLITEKKNNNTTPTQQKAPKRPQTLSSETHKIRVDFGDGNPRNAYVTVSFFPNSRKPYEIFVVSPYQGLDEKDLQILELTTRTTSMNLRHGLPIKYICEQLDKIGGQYIFSVPTNIAKLLRQYDEEKAEGEKKPNGNGQDSFSKCPSCKKRAYVLSEGCGNCVNPDCLYSGCS